MVNKRRACTVKRRKHSSVFRRLQYRRIAAVAGMLVVTGFGINMLVSASKDATTTQVEAVGTEQASVTARAFEREPDMIKKGSIRCMVYTGGEVTYTGVTPYVGCVAGSKELLGKDCYLYKTDKNGTKGELIGKFKFDDTGYGVDGNIANGDAICVYRCNTNSCNNWIDTYGDDVYIEVFDE